MNNISNNLNIDPNKLKKFFKSNMINYNQYRNEVEIEFLWQKLIAQLYSSKININKTQIEKEIKEILNQKKDESIKYKLAELEINYDNVNKNDLIKEIKRSIKDIGFSKQ